MLGPRPPLGKPILVKAPKQLVSSPHCIDLETLLVQPPFGLKPVVNKPRFSLNLLVLMRSRFGHHTSVGRSQFECQFIGQSQLSASCREDHYVIGIQNLLCVYHCPSFLTSISFFLFPVFGFLSI